MSINQFRNKKPDYLLLLVVFGLAAFGLIMIYSASVVYSYELFGYNSYYLKKQAISLLISIIVLLIFSNIDYRFWQKNAFWMLVCTLILLVAVFIPGLGRELGGAHRWIHIGPLFFQPSEVIKLSFFIYLSAWLVKRGGEIRDFQYGLIPFLLMIGFIGFLIMKEPDMGTMIVIALTAGTIFFVAGAKIKHIFLIIASAAGLFWGLVKSAPYRMQRFLVFLNPNQEVLGASYHINQALLAIGSGGLLGLGFGQSKQKFLYLPSAHTDSIFAIIAEELGFLRTSLVILAFLFIAWRGYQIARTAPDAFSKFLAVGITTWIVVQALVNIFAMTGLVPLTGVPLPFISYGGSSLVVLFAAIGILMNISKQSAK